MEELIYNFEKLSENLRQLNTQVELMKIQIDSNKRILNNELIHRSRVSSDYDQELLNIKYSTSFGIHYQIAKLENEINTLKNDLKSKEFLLNEYKIISIKYFPTQKY